MKPLQVRLVGGPGAFEKIIIDGKDFTNYIRNFELKAPHDELMTISIDLINISVEGTYDIPGYIPAEQIDRYVDAKKEKEK
jgi:hypothetical protein